MHKYYCIVIRMRCWLMDNCFFFNIVLIVYIRVSRKSYTLCTWYIKRIFTNTGATLKKTKLHAIEYCSIYIISRPFLFIRNNSRSVEPALSFLYIPIYSLIYPPVEMFVHFTYPTAYRSIWFVLISRVKPYKAYPLL